MRYVSIVLGWVARLRYTCMGFELGNFTPEMSFPKVETHFIGIIRSEFDEMKIFNKIVSLMETFVQVRFIAKIFKI